MQTLQDAMAQRLLTFGSSEESFGEQKQLLDLDCMQLRSISKAV